MSNSSILRSDPSNITGGGFILELPANHNLPNYQSSFRLYDKFLPHLAKYLPEFSTVLDIGANCGDTVVSMSIANPKLDFVCIEPDSYYYKFLETNTNKLKAENISLNVRNLKLLVGKSVTSAFLSGHAGTKSAVPSDASGAIKSKALDAILDEQEISRVSLIKVDVDGYDFDVLDSGMNAISNKSPILYFEYFVENSSQKHGYEATIQTLALLGYSNYSLFDNFGQHIINSKDLNLVLQFADYVWRQNQLFSARTINYFDLLVWKSESQELVETAISDYLVM